MSLTARIAIFPGIVTAIMAAMVAGPWIGAGPPSALAAGKVEKAAPKVERAPSRVRIAPPSEPGTPLLLHVRIENAATGRPISGARLFVYQTDDAGFYRKGQDGREQGPQESRLRARAHSDSQGAVVFDTVVPGSYPGSGIFRHIHYSLSAAGYEPQEKEIILDESPRPTEEQKRWAARNGDIVSRREKGQKGTSEMRVTLKLQPAKEG